MFTKEHLSHFTGSENFYRYNFLGTSFVYTDGIQYLMLNGAAWLVDAIASYQPRKDVKNCRFQVWELEVKDSKAVLTMREDTDMPIIVKQEIPYTDFPLDSFKLWLVNGTLLLPSEY